MHFTVVPHVHWDREWYFTQQKSQVYLNRYLSDVMDALDADPSIPQYLFDAQTSIVDDYLADHPEREPQLRRLVSARRLLTGPWYTQCDQLVVHGESIVRNLLYGTRRARELGHCLNVGYAPDCFGQAAQLPQIMAGFGIPSVMFKRGIDADVIPSDDFIWESDDGSAVYAYHLLDYMNFRSPSSADATKNAALVEKIEAEYEPRSLSGEAFLFNGFDQHPLRADIREVVDAMGKDNVSFGDLEGTVLRMGQTPGLPVYRGELTSGMTTRVHKSIFSSRADIKALNSKVENELIRIVEPLQAIYHGLTGRDERALVSRIWKRVMECSAHDSIGCCNSDEVNRDIAARLRAAMSAATEYEKLTYRQIAEGVDVGPASLQAYNFLPWERTQEVELSVLSPFESLALQDTRGRRCAVEVLFSRDVTSEVLSVSAWATDASNGVSRYGAGPWYECRVRAELSLPAMGYETFAVVKGKALEHCPTSPTYDLENDWLGVKASPDGTLEVTEKRTGHVYHQMLELVDDVDAGDSYDWSSDPEAPLVVSSVGSAAEVERLDGRRLRIRVGMMLPRNRAERMEGHCSVEEKVELLVALPSDRPMLHVSAKVANAAVDHRLRVLLPADIPSDVSHADQTFGLIERPTRLAASQTWRERGWNERPRTIEPMQSLCYLEGHGRLVELVTDSVKEYQVVGEQMETIAYTLMRSFTKMGRPDLPDRPGRESGKPWDTPDAALLGTHEFTFAIAFPASRAEAVRLASEYTTPVRVHQASLFDMSHDEFIFGGFSPKVPASFSALRVEGEVQHSIFKLAEDEGGGCVLRVTSLCDGPVQVVPREGEEVLLTNLVEDSDRTQGAEEAFVSNQIITYRIREA